MCVLHTVHGAFKHVGNVSGRGIGKIYEMYKIFDQPSARRADYEKISDVFHYIFMLTGGLKKKKMLWKEGFKNMVKTVIFWMELPKQRPK